MIAPLFGLLTPSDRIGMGIAIAIVFIMICVFVMVTARREHKRYNERTRRAGLGILAIVAGPLVGAGLAGLTNTLAGVHPMDVKYTYVVFTIIGSIAGFIVGVAFAVTSLFTPQDVRERRSASRSAEPFDEL